MAQPTFQLRIELGNDAMQEPADVALALRDVADRLESIMGFPGTQSVFQTSSPRIRDANGNTVGRWEVIA